MFAKIELKIINNNVKKITVNMSSIFQGILMEMIDMDFVTELHTQQRHPYSQFIRYDENWIYWTITTVTQEAYEKIIVPLLNSKRNQISCSYHDMQLEIKEKHVECMTQKEFLEKQYFKDFSKSFTVTFLTPTSFKSKGQYMNYPTVRWIFQSLMNKHDSNEIENQIFDEEILQMIEEQACITQYKLKSTFFHLEGIKIPAFVGSIKLYARSNQSVVNLINYLLKYGEFSGVGIKSAIGMGAIKVENRERKME